MIRTAPSPQTAPRKKSGENFSAEKNPAEKNFRPKFFRPKKIRPKTFRSKNFSAEKFAVRIAEGGNDGGGPGGREPPPGTSVRIGENFSAIFSEPPLIQHALTGGEAFS